mgnify:CR=1 FL=1
MARQQQWLIQIRRATLAIAVTLLPTVPATAQEPLASAFSPTSSRDDHQLLLVERSESGKSLYAYSSLSGRWDKLTAQPHPESPFPIVSLDFAVLRGPEHLHGFCLKTGAWSTIDTDGVPSVIIVSAGAAACSAGTHLYAFSPHTGEWDEIDVQAATDMDNLEVGGNFVRYRHGTEIFMFSSTAGKWASVDLAVD